MARFRVVIAPGVAHIIDAANEDEARKKTKAEIAKGAVSPFYDELFFELNDLLLSSNPTGCLNFYQIQHPNL